MRKIALNEEGCIVGRLKASQFNEYLGNFNDKWVIVNHLSGGMIEVPHGIYESLLNNEISRIEGKTSIESLKYGNFVVHGEMDEVEGLKKRKRDWGESSITVGMQIVPTLACNFKCPYCYENQGENRVFMSKEVMDDILRYVDKAIKPSTKIFHVAWYGGEPLLAVKQIEYLSEAFLKLSKERNFEYRASIITNGYLLNKKNVDTLLRYKLKSLQVTIDGPQKIHDKRRMLINGRGTWQKIVNNLKYALEKKIGVVVRVNIDRTNIDSLSSLFEELQEEDILNKITLSLGAVSTFGNVCKSVEDTLITLEEADKKIGQEKLHSMLKQTKNHLRRYTPNFSGCVAVAKNSIIVGPSGELYKCSKTIGSADEIWGHISNPDRENPNFKKWENITNLDDESCKKCPVLPLCHGSGCAFEFVINGKTVITCDSQRFREGYIENLKELYRKNNASNK